METLEPVKFYEGPFYMFSNFASFAVVWRGKLWPTSEHAYQAAKFNHPTLQEGIRKATSAHMAKKIAEQYDEQKRPDWHEVNVAIMEEILRAKLEQHPYIREKLIKTGERKMIEDSPKDAFWGRGPDHQGQNHLGRIWMKLREEIVAKQE